MIWGLTLEPGKDYSQLVQDEVQLSMATMEIRGCIGSKDEKYSHVVMRTNSTEYLLCTLVGGVTYQQGLDLKLMPNEKVTFTVQGTNTVYLTGYSYMSMEVDAEQGEDWIEDPSLEDALPQESGDFVEEGEDSYYPSEQEHQQLENEASTPIDEKYTVLMEVKPEEQQHLQHGEDSPTEPSFPRESQTDMTVPSSHPRPPLQQQMSGPANPPRPPMQQSTGILGVNIKTELHPIAEVEEPPINQSFPEQPVEVRAEPTHLPSTSAGISRELSEERMREIERNWSRIFKDKGLTYQRPGISAISTTSQTSTHSQLPRKPTEIQNLRRKQKDPVRCMSPPEAGVTMGWKYSCYKCGRIFSDQRSKLRHEIQHKCRFCQKEFLQVGYALRHEDIHTMPLKHKCRFCDKRFRVQSTKLQHERIHTGEKPYKCGYCDEWFNHRESKRRHERKHLMPSMLQE